MSVEDFTVVVPTRGGRAALRAIADNIAAHLDGCPLVLVLNRDTPPDQASWDHLRRCCPHARYYLCDGGGVARARNLALRLLPTNLIAFVDDDVVLQGTGSVEALVEALDESGAGVATARVRPAPSSDEAAPLHRHFLGLDRGPVSRIFRRQDANTLTPTTAWALGVGAAFAISQSRIDACPSPPTFDETLSNGQFCGGAEDVDFFLQCLLAGIPVAYCADALLLHTYPSSIRSVATKMRQYARADGAFYAKWSRLLGWRDVSGDAVDWARRVKTHAQRSARRQTHVPLLPLLCEPIDKLVGAAWWRLVGAR